MSDMVTANEATGSDAPGPQSEPLCPEDMTFEFRRTAALRILSEMIDRKDMKQLLAGETIAVIAAIQDVDRAAFIRLLNGLSARNQKTVEQLVKEHQSQQSTTHAEANANSDELFFAAMGCFDRQNLLSERPEAPVLMYFCQRGLDAAIQMLPAFVVIPWFAGNGPDEGIGNLGSLRKRQVVLWSPPCGKEENAQLQGEIYDSLMGKREGMTRAVADHVVIADNYGIAVRLGTELPSNWSMADAKPEWSPTIEEELLDQLAMRIPRGYQVKQDGVYKKDNEGYRRISGSLQIVACTRDERQNNWGKLIRWRDFEGHLHQRALANELLAGNGEEIRRVLANGGLFMGVGKWEREALQSYINDCATKRIVMCVSQPGWHCDRYVLRDRQGTTFGTGDLAVPQGPLFSEPLVVHGTLEEWQREVAALCIGNNRLIFIVSAAFAGPCLRFAGIDGGGFHFQGISSSGKSTLLACPASVWGIAVAVWRATDNGLEGLCAASNDLLLILDEIKQLDPRLVAEVTYMIANGQGRRRMKVNAELRESHTWLTLPISAGEITIADHAASAGQKLHVGAALRLVTIQPDPTARFDFFADVHGAMGANDKARGGAFADRLKEAAKSYVGTAGPAFLKRLVEDLAGAQAQVRADIDAFIQAVVPAQASAQVFRVAKRFAVVAAAGELAIAYGIVPWPRGAARASAESCFASWYASWSGKSSNAEEVAAVEQVRIWLIANRSARFEPLKRDTMAVYYSSRPERISNCAGWYRDASNGAREYLVPIEVWKGEVCKGMDPARVARACVAVGIVQPDSEGKPTTPTRLPGVVGTERIYVLRLTGTADGTAGGPE